MHVGWVAAPGSIEMLARTLQPLSIGLIDELVAMTAFCPVAADCRALPSPPMEICRYGRLKWWAFPTRAVEALADEAGRRKIDLLHALDVPALELTLMLAERTGLPYLASSYCIGDWKKIRALGARPLALLAGSELVRRDLADHHAPADTIELLRPGVYQVRQATCFTTPGHCVTIVAGGSLNYYEAFAAVLRSFARLLQSPCDCELFIIGGGSGERALRDLTDKLGVRQRVTFSAPMPAAQLSGILKAADIFISPAPSDCIDVGSLLALASGVPVLSTPDRASDFLIDAQTARMFTEGDSAALSEHLLAMVREPASAVALVERALAHMKEHFSPTRMVSQLAEIYRRYAPVR